MFLFLGMILLFSCSKDDNSLTDSNYLGELVVSVSQQDISEGDKVFINVKNEKGELVEGARVFINNQQVNRLYEFTSAGKFRIVAKKAGYRDSKAAEVTVKRFDMLLLSADKQEIFIGERVIFSIKNGSNELVKDAKVYDVNTGAVLEDNIFVPSEVGEYRFIAKSPKFKSSVEVIVKVNLLTNSFGFGEFKFDAESIFGSIRQTKLSNGKVVDKVVVVNGVPMNEILVMAMKFNDDLTYSYLDFTVLVPNSTIKVDKDNKVLDYGKRVSVKNANGCIVTSAFTTDVNGVNTQYLVSDNSLKQPMLNEFVLDIPNDGVGAGEEGIEGTAKVSFKTGAGIRLFLNFKGIIYFGETVK